MNSDTPETDKMMADWIQGIAQEIPNFVEASRRFERERDEERDTLTQIHRWIERNHPDGFIDSLSHFKNLERVTDRWYERFDSLERERDEALELAQQMSESNQVLLADVRFYRSAWEKLKKKNHE